MDALFGRAAALRRVELVPPKNVIGKSTIESIQSGAVYGFSGQVDALVDRFQRELGPCTVVSTGGLAEADHPALPHDPALRAVAHPPGPAHRLRTEPVADVTDTSETPSAPTENASAGSPSSTRCARAGVDPYPVASIARTPRRRCSSTGARSRPGTETEDVVRVAGRIVLLRRQGKLTFATLRDGAGAIQLFVRPRRPR